MKRQVQHIISACFLAFCGSVFLLFSLEARRPVTAQILIGLGLIFSAFYPAGLVIWRSHVGAGRLKATFEYDFLVYGPTRLYVAPIQGVGRGLVQIHLHSDYLITKRIPCFIRIIELHLNEGGTKTVSREHKSEFGTKYSADAFFDLAIYHDGAWEISFEATWPQSSFTPNIFHKFRQPRQEMVFEIAIHGQCHNVALPDPFIDYQPLDDGRRGFEPIMNR